MLEVCYTLQIIVVDGIFRQANIGLVGAKSCEAKNSPARAWGQDWLPPNFRCTCSLKSGSWRMIRPSLSRVSGDGCVTGFVRVGVVPMTPVSASICMFSSDLPSTADSAHRLCSPSRGAELKMRPGVSENFHGLLAYGRGGMPVDSG